MPYKSTRVLHNILPKLTFLLDTFSWAMPRGHKEQWTLARSGPNEALHSAAALASRYHAPATCVPCRFAVRGCLPLLLRRGWPRVQAITPSS